jgi:hypothetical protein
MLDAGEQARITAMWTGVLGAPSFTSFVRPHMFLHCYSRLVMTTYIFSTIANHRWHFFHP